MTDLETKRNAIMNSVSSGMSNNLLETMTLAKGFIGNNGVINQPDQRKELYTVDFLESGRYYFVVEPTSGNAWLEEVYYNLDETFKSRNSRESTQRLEFTIASNEKGRVSFVTNGEANVGLYRVDTFLLDYDEV